ncbi:Luciferase-like, subgroup [Sphingobium chlorophenolicum L-1]|uniref:Luciferase-like, subgroup n=1 Tax=Sphingobium chlorophenolicum L-1 TaxID=690566 RepID=F6EZ95_SPHCR|nr:LLM class flavin-dependent oxidoreductase [Sphingobium chlorophenolicum]AEG50188.1 Luciferase-like, subgroup [Sphingobium chlorophenolicum L-1]
MQFGVFDQNDWSGRPIVEQYEERLSLAALYEESGFYCYHMSEHHGTPLSTTPSPSVFLAALSQRTTRLRFGPLVFLLPGYNPLRLIEEIGMLDNLSRGRFEFGAGRGASPHEMGYLGVAAEDMQPMYQEALDIILSGLSAGTVDYQGQYWRYSGVELSVRPIQDPYPRLWVAMGGSPQSATWPARHGANIICGAPATPARGVFQHYLNERAKAPDHGNATPLMGLNRWIVVADTDAEATAIAHRAWNIFYANFIKLWRRHGGTPDNKLPEDFDQMLTVGAAVVGSPETVRAKLTDQVQISGANFLSSTFVFGDISLDEARSSIALFTNEIMPALTTASRDAHAALLAA